MFFIKVFCVLFKGDLENEEGVLKWLIDEKSEGKAEIIELVDRETLEILLEEVDYIAVFFYDPDDCDNCEKILEELEHIDDDTDKHGIHFVKTEDDDYASEIGITELPALVYFEDGNPSIYDEDLLDEEEVLKWLIEQRNEETIENINKAILAKMISEEEYLAVLFYKVCVF